MIHPVGRKTAGRFSTRQSIRTLRTATSGRCHSRGRLPGPSSTSRGGTNNTVSCPNGRWLAYVSNESDRYEVHVRSLEGTAISPIFTAGGSQPQWRDDSELIYLGLDRALMAVALTGAAGTFEAGSPQRLFSTRTKMIEIQGTAAATASPATANASSSPPRPRKRSPRRSRSCWADFHRAYAELLLHFLHEFRPPRNLNGFVCTEFSW